MQEDKLSEDIEKLKGLVNKKMGEVEIASQQSNDEGLSLGLTALARINASLGMKAAWAKYIARNSQRAFDKIKETRDMKRSELTLSLSETQAVGKSEHQAKVDSYRQYSPEIEVAFGVWSDAQLVADEIDSLGYRVDNYCKMAQSRLSLIKAEKK